jgi:hypothetical protein
MSPANGNPVPNPPDQNGRDPGLGKSEKPGDDGSH